MSDVPPDGATIGALAYRQNDHFTCFARSILAPYKHPRRQNSDSRGGRLKMAMLRGWKYRRTRHIAENEARGILVMELDETRKTDDQSWIGWAGGLRW